MPNKYMSARHSTLKPYVPGEQPKQGEFLKLNTNESPFSVASEAYSAMQNNMRDVKLYPDPTYAELRASLANLYNLEAANVIVGNGSDEVLNFAFMALCDDERPAVFPDISYGFYPVFAQVNNLPSVVVPLKEDLSVDIDALAKTDGTIFLANPNAPTGIAVVPETVAALAEAKPNRVIVVDEAYVDFGAQSCVPLVKTHENILVTQTFSKSRSMAGARLGFAFGQPALIECLETVRNSLNPYNVNSLTVALALEVLLREDQTRANCSEIARVRALTAERLTELGFEVTPSQANFLFVKHNKISGQEIYEKLKARTILVRHFNVPRIVNYNRITIGTEQQMNTLVAKLKEIVNA
jgi:histidinol-phosphate aminotransferase